MRIIYIIALAFISLSCASQNDDEALYGAYSYKEGETLYQDFELNADYTFHSWLHNHPASSGTWSLNNEVLQVTETGSDHTVQITIIELNQDSATLLFSGMTKPAIFEKIE